MTKDLQLSFYNKFKREIEIALEEKLISENKNNYLSREENLSKEFINYVRMISPGKNKPKSFTVEKSGIEHVLSSALNRIGFYEIKKENDLYKVTHTRLIKDILNNYDKRF